MLRLLLTGGYVSPVVVSLKTKHILDGHLRHKLALDHGIPELPVVYVRVTEDEELLVLATFDPLGFMAETKADLQWSVSRAALALVSDEELSSWLHGCAPADMTMDHTAALVAGDDVGAGAGGVVRQIQFILSVDAYARAVRLLVEIMEQRGLEDTYEAVRWLVAEYGHAGV